MNNWERLGIAPADPPNLAELLSEATGIGVAESLRNEIEIKDALLAECIRIALYSASVEGMASVFHRRLRSWVSRKLKSVLPELFLPESSDYRDTIEKLEFLGDLIELADGYLMPGHPRCVQAGPGSYLLVSGHPTRAFQTLSSKITITRFGRRIENSSDEELAHLGIGLQQIDSYLEIPDAKTPQEVVSHILSTSHQQVPVSSTWEVYRDKQGGYEFYWTTYDVRRTGLGMVVDHEGMKLSLLREPIGQNYWYYWLQVVSGSDKWFHRVASKDWKWVCLALDRLSGRPREAIIVVSESGSAFRLLIGFSPFKALFRWLLAVGRFIGRKSGREEWELPVSGLEQTRKFLESSGVSVRLVEGGVV